MNVKDLKFDDVYQYKDTNLTVSVKYAGMREDNYLFVPYDTNDNTCIGQPCALNEKEVRKYIQETLSVYSNSNGNWFVKNNTGPIAAFSSRSGAENYIKYHQA